MERIVVENEVLEVWYEVDKLWIFFYDEWVEKNFLR